MTGTDTVAGVGGNTTTWPGGVRTVTVGISPAVMVDVAPGMSVWSSIMSKVYANVPPAKIAPAPKPRLRFHCGRWWAYFAGINLFASGETAETAHAALEAKINASLCAARARDALYNDSDDLESEDFDWSDDY